MHPRHLRSTILLVTLACSPSLGADAPAPRKELADAPQVQVARVAESAETSASEDSAPARQEAPPPTRVFKAPVRARGRSARRSTYSAKWTHPPGRVGATRTFASLSSTTPSSGNSTRGWAPQQPSSGNSASRATTLARSSAAVPPQPYISRRTAVDLCMAASTRCITTACSAPGRSSKQAA